MPTDIVELCIAASCIVSLTLVHGETLAPKDGLDRTARAVATGMASTLMLVVANCAAFLLNTILLPLTSLPPSTIANTVPLGTMVVAVIVVLLITAATKKLHAALHPLLATLAPAIMPSTLLLAAVTALTAPAQNVLHAALVAIGAGFGFTLLLRLCVAITAVDSMSSASMAAAGPNSWRSAWQRIAENSQALALMLAGLLAIMLAAVFNTVW